MLDDDYSKDKDAILACLDKLFEVPTIQREETIYCEVPFNWNYFAIGHGKGVADEIDGEAKSNVLKK